MREYTIFDIKMRWQVLDDIIDNNDNIIEFEEMWGIKTWIIPFVVGALGVNEK